MPKGDPKINSRLLDCTGMVQLMLGMFGLMVDTVTGCNWVILMQRNEHQWNTHEYSGL